VSNCTCISTGHQLNIPSLDKSSTVCQLISTGQLVSTGNSQEHYWNTSEDTLLDVWGATKNARD
jgi:hypothetical protein